MTNPLKEMFDDAAREDARRLARRDGRDFESLPAREQALYEVRARQQLREDLARQGIV